MINTERLNLMIPSSSHLIELYNICSHPQANIYMNKLSIIQIQGDTSYLHGIQQKLIQWHFRLVIPCSSFMSKMVS